MGLADAGASCPSERKGVSITKSTLSHHLKVLREAGLTRSHVEGKNIFVVLRRDDLEARFPGLLQSILVSVRHSNSSKADRPHRLPQSTVPLAE
ncbi:MAG: helix-turn-helix transcriptional regulator [Ktedonobacteraceae bacterium]|nr:helix-turn-helix transcriptional regulator [Ktedonobacteraceae bacterium]